MSKYISKYLKKNRHNNHILNYPKSSISSFATNDIWVIPTQAIGSKRSVDSSTFADTDGYVASTSTQFKHHIRLLLLITSNITIYKLFSSFHLHLFQFSFRIHTCYIYIYGSPSPGPTFWGGNVSLPKCGVEYFQDMLRKHCEFWRFMHILLVVFWSFCSLIR